MILNKTKKRIILFILTIILIFGMSSVYIKLEYITRKQVKTIISEDLGVKKEMLDNYNINLKRKNKKFIYEVTFKYMNETYTYQISAKTGTILTNKTS